MGLKNKRLKPKGKQVIVPGELLKLPYQGNVVDLSAESTTLVLSLVSAPIQDIMWEFDRDSLAPTRAISDSLPSSRIEYALSVVSEIGTPECLPYLLDMVDHPAHFIRWAVVKNVARLDESEGMRLLRKATEDVHPHVRNAARETLRRIEADQTTSA